MIYCYQNCLAQLPPPVMYPYRTKTSWKLLKSVIGGLRFVCDIPTTVKKASVLGSSLVRNVIRGKGRPQPMEMFSEWTA